MDFDLAGRLIDLARESALSGTSAQGVHDAVVSAAAEPDGGPWWDAIRKVDVNSDVRRVRPWIITAIERSSPDVSGIWLGLYELANSPSAIPSPALKLTGSSSYPDTEWLFKQDWEVEGYAPAPGLGSLIHLASEADGDTRWLVSYAVVFGYSLGVICEIARGDFAAVAIKGRPQLAIAMGFHDGDILQAGVVEPPGRFDMSGMDWI